VPVEFRVLGQIEALVDGRVLDVGHARQRSVLAALLIEANRVVSVDQLVERVWGSAYAPGDPRSVLRTYLWHLRRALAATQDVALERHAPGYKLVMDERTVDLYRFRDLLTQAETAGDDGKTADLIEQALELWRGEPFAGLDTPWINAARHNLLLRRQSARLDLTDIRLRLGRHTAVLAEVTDHAAEHPLDERIAGQLMLALHRSGRSADALAQYQRTRNLLADEMGTDPGPALRRLQQQILTADPALTLPIPGARSRAATVPRQLPATPRPFTGRVRELARLSAAVDERADPGGTLVISAIGGAGGIGKTWLALHWAHQYADRFPDGQLYVDLRGFDPSGEPMLPQSALQGFLDALGVAPAAIPPDVNTATALYRSLLVGKRMLVVLDNARDATQVVPLLPGSPGCTVLVTSRRQLAGLISAHGAQPLALDVLSDAEAHKLLAHHLGADRVAAEPDAIALLLEYCAGLPLALGIIAARALLRPDLPLAVLADELRDASARLAALETTDITANLRAALSWSYDALTPDAARALGLLAMAPGPDIGAQAAARLLDLPVADTRPLLREMEDAFLLQQNASGRYRMHDLIRLYAADRAEHEHAVAQREAALRRLLDFYTRTAQTADRLLAPHRPLTRLALTAPGNGHQPLPDASAAMAWLQAEHPNLLAAQHTAAGAGLHPAVWQLAWALATFHYRTGHYYDELMSWRAALEAAEHLPDPATRAETHRFLGRAYAGVGHLEEATSHIHQSLDLAVRHREPAAEAHGHEVLAWVWAARGDDRQALHHATCSLDLCRALGQPVWEAEALNAVGWYAARLGDHDTARAHCQAALALHKRHHNSTGEAETSDSLGYIAHHAGRHEEAIRYYRQALVLFRGLGDVYAIPSALDYLSRSLAAVDQHREARAGWQEALELFRTQRRGDDAERVQHQLDSLETENASNTVRTGKGD
jgi:DNA-binding SARP family transcriptional activator/tetratricopeptide (TPR) repeat protein